jgi:hypothetical protein
MRLRQANALLQAHDGILMCIRSSCFSLIMQRKWSAKLQKRNLMKFGAAYNQAPNREYTGLHMNAPVFEVGC